jgi:predicted permease
VALLILWRRLMARIRRSRLDADFAEEIREHLALRRDALIDAGADPRHAELEARRLFGNQTVIKERARELWTIPLLSSLALETRFALRLLVRNPIHSAVVVGMIAIGTALNGAVFVIMDAAFLRIPDVPQVEQLVRLDDGEPAVGVTYPDYVDYRDRAAAALDIAAFAPMRVDARIARGGDSLDERVTALLASGNYFDVLKGAALRGRTFDGTFDLPPAGTAVTVLGETYWERRFNRDEGVIGTTITLNHQPFRIIGIVAASFKGVELFGATIPEVRELYVPMWSRQLLAPGETPFVERTLWWGLQTVGRLRPGVGIAQARQELATAAAALDREYPGARDRRRPRLTSVSRFDFAQLRGEPGLLAAAAVGVTILVMLIACANVTNLGLARACARSRETAIRLSLGAGRWRLVRQFLTESLVLSAIGTVAGFALAIAGLRVVMATGDGQPLMLAPSFNLSVFVYAGLIALLVSGITGLVPALQASRPTLMPALKDSHGQVRRRWLRGLFVGGEVAICLVLLVAGSLFVRSAQRARAIDPILPAANILAVEIGDAAQLGYNDLARRQLLDDLQRRIQGVPGVITTALATPLPFSGARYSTTVQPAGGGRNSSVRVFLSKVSPSFFAVSSLPVVRGRIFTDDAREEVVVNQTMAARVWGNADPIGQSFTSGQYARNNHVVVGIVRDAPFVSLQLRNEPFMFRPIDPASGDAIVARTAVAAAGARRAAAAAAQAADARLAIGVTTLADGIDNEIGAVRASASVIGGVGALALALALFGVGAVTAQAVAQRTHEIGVRMALGATTTDAVSFIVRQSMRPVAGGIVIGIGAAALLSRALTALLYGLSSIDPIAFGTSALFLIAASVVASWLPARRAARVDPLLALRAE